MTKEGADLLISAFAHARGNGNELAKYLLDNGLVRNSGLMDPVEGEEPYITHWNDRDTQKRVLRAFQAIHPDLFGLYGREEARSFLDNLIKNAAAIAWLQYGDW